VLLLTLVVVMRPHSAQAHPVPKNNHDRTIVVHLSQDTQKGLLAVTVDYRLEVGEFTAIYVDLPALGEKIELNKVATPIQYYEAYLTGYAPILAANLVGTIDGEPLVFRCVKKRFSLNDENGDPLNHLRCDFVFRAETRSLWPELMTFACCWPRPGLPASVALASLLNARPADLPGAAHLGNVHQLKFKETNYEQEEGQIRLSFAGKQDLRLLSKIEPDHKLLVRPTTELEPGDDAKLRTLQTTFSVEEATPDEPTVVAKQEPAPLVPSQRQLTSRLPSLYHLFRDSAYGFWVLILFSTVIGAVHALTPGHGKTLVAAYLVGERGTVAHACLLGVVTTLTHTGVVIAIAVALRVFFPDGGMNDAAKQDLQTALGLGGGLLIVCLGVWLLLRRLTGQVDHVHLPGHGHHHHHGGSHSHSHETAVDHYHDGSGNALPLPASKLTWWGLIVLGITGGIVPCWDAILMLIVAVSTNLLWLALPMLLAFSAGLAGVLILIGILVVRAKSLAGSRWGDSRLFRSLPVISAALVTCIGLWLCYDSVHASGSSTVNNAPSSISDSGLPSSLGERERLH